MNSYVNLIEKLFDHFEKEKLTEQEIFDKCVNLVINRKCDPDYTWDLNDTLYNRGYSFQFEVPRISADFDSKTYENLSSQVTKSKAKTKALVDYLIQINDHRLTLASLHMLKVQHLIDLGYMTDDAALEGCKNLTLRELLYGNYHNETIKNIAKSALENVGFIDAKLQYNDFRIDMEYLLWTIEREDKKYGHLKINTIKVALEIAPKEFFEKDGKLYYNVNTAKESKKYIKLIDREAIQKMKSKWGEQGYETLRDGYRLLHQYF